jgi:hypothetical protein
VNEVATELVDALAAYEEASTEESSARHKKTDALNRLNNALKAFDKTVSDLRSSAPRESDWRRVGGDS